MNIRTTPGLLGNEDQEQPWLRRVDENNLWYSRFSAYLALGPLRTKLAVYRAEKERKSGNKRDNSRTVPSSWNDAARRYDWIKRAEAFDEWRRKEIFSEGLAQDSERVKRLVALAEQMCAKLTAEFDSLVVNDRYIGQLLALFDLIAKHTTGYPATRIEHTGKDGKPIEVEETRPQVIFYMPEVAELIPNNGTQIEEIDSLPETTKDSNND